MREWDVSDIKRAIKDTGAAIIIITHIEYRQLWYSWIMYAPVNGPRAGPRKGAMIKKSAARPWACACQRSAMVPAPTASAPDPPKPARNRKIIRVARLFEDAAMAVKVRSKGMVVQ